MKQLLLVPGPDWDSSRAISRSQSRMLWRCTSVGCAVSTGETRARSNQLQQRRRVDAGFARAVERIGEAARPPRRAGIGVRAAAAVLLLVLGDVEKVREIAEGAHQLQGLR